MESLVLWFFISVVVSTLITPWVIWLAKRYDFIRYPPSLAVHKMQKEKDINMYIATRKHFGKPPTPLLGGLVYFFTTISLLLASVPFLSSTQLGNINVMQYVFWFLGLIILLCLGILDDKKSIPIYIHIGGYFVSAILFASSFFGILHIYQVIVYVFLIVLVSFALKLQAGADALMEGYVFWILVFVFLFSFKHASFFSLLLIVVFAGSLLGFLFFNIYPAKVFSGSTGKNIIGYLLLSLALFSYCNIWIVISLVSLPVVDMIYVVFKRFIKYKSLKKALTTSDRTHLHHRLMDLGLTEMQVVGFEYMFVIIFGILFFVFVQILHMQFMLKVLASVSYFASLIIVLLVNYKVQIKIKKG